MFQVHRESDNRLHITMSGKLDTEKMAKALDDLIERSEGIENGKMLFDVVNYHLPSFGAIELELSRFPTLFRWIRHFRRVAVLSDKQWIKVVSELEGLFIPGVLIKGFSREEKAQALAWLDSEDKSGAETEE